jgi:hypothetical protein
MAAGSSAVCGLFQKWVGTVGTVGSRRLVEGGGGVVLGEVIRLGVVPAALQDSEPSAREDANGMRVVAAALFGGEIDGASYGEVRRELSVY